MEAISSASGQKHSKWLSMMYPRLVAAKELLTDDGVIFISIDDNEQANLKLLCDEVFGGGNFVDIVIRKTKSFDRDKSNKELQKLYDFMLVYCKNKNELTLNQDITGIRQYPFKDEIGEYKLNPLQNTGPHGFRDLRPKTYYEIFLLKNGKYTTEKPQKEVEIVKSYLPDKIGNRDGCWSWQKSKIEAENHRIVLKNDKLFIKIYKDISADQNKYASKCNIIEDAFNTKGSISLNKLELQGLFSNPKPVELIKWCLQLASNKTSIILDFFAGSGTTGQAVMELNNEDGGDRKFILVQLPEKISEKQPAYKFCKDNNFEPVISSITKERLRRAGAKITQQQDLLNKVDVGFKCYKIVENPTQNQFEENLFGWNEKNNDFLLSYIALMYGYGLNFTATKIETFENREFYLLSSDMMELASAVCILEKEPISDNDVLKLVQVLQKEYETKTLQFFARDSALSLETSWNLMQHFDKKKVVVF